MVAPFHEKAKLRSKSSPMAATQPPRPTPGLKPTKSSGMRDLDEVALGEDEPGAKVRGRSPQAPALKGSPGGS